MRANRLCFHVNQLKFGPKRRRNNLVFLPRFMIFQGLVGIFPSDPSSFFGLALRFAQTRTTRGSRVGAVVLNKTTILHILIFSNYLFRYVAGADPIHPQGGPTPARCQAASNHAQKRDRRQLKRRLRQGSALGFGWRDWTEAGPQAAQPQARR
jgi:hypothetical protein